MWCLACMGKWFASRQDPQRPDTWLASRVPCPAPAALRHPDVCACAEPLGDPAAASRGRRASGPSSRCCGQIFGAATHWCPEAAEGPGCGFGRTFLLKFCPWQWVVFSTSASFTLSAPPTRGQCWACRAWCRVHLQSILWPRAASSGRLPWSAPDDPNLAVCLKCMGHKSLNCSSVTRQTWICLRLCPVTLTLPGWPLAPGMGALPTEAALKTQCRAWRWRARTPRPPGDRSQPRAPLLGGVAPICPLPRDAFGLSIRACFHLPFPWPSACGAAPPLL